MRKMTALSQVDTEFFYRLKAPHGNEKITSRSIVWGVAPPPEVYAYERTRPTTKNCKKLPAQSKLVRVCIVLVSRALVLLCKYHFCGSVGAYLTL